MAERENVMSPKQDEGLRGDGAILVNQEGERMDTGVLGEDVQDVCLLLW